MVMKYLQQHQLNCVLVLPAMNFRWVNIVSAYIQDLQVLAAPFDHTVFTVLNNEGKCIPKRYPFAMIAVKLDFYPPCTALNKLFLNSYLTLLFYIVGTQAEHPQSCPNLAQ